MAIKTLFSTDMLSSCYDIRRGIHTTRNAPQCYVVYKRPILLFHVCTQKVTFYCRLREN